MAKAAKEVANGPGVVMVGGTDSNEEYEVEIPSGDGKESPEKETVANVKLNDQEAGEREQELDEDARLAYDVSEEGDEERRPSRRQRRNASRRVAMESKDRTISDLTAKVDALSTELRRVTTGQQSVTIAHVENELRAAQQALHLANAELAKAVAESDGAKFAELQQLRDEANTRVWQLGNMRNRMIMAAREEAQAQPDQRQQQQGNGQGQSALHPSAERFVETFMERFPYFDPNGSDEDSRIMKAIDDGVAADGYLPHTPLYWRTLEKRLAAKGFVPETEGDSRPRDREDDGEDDGYQPRRESRRENDSLPNRPPVSRPRNGSRPGTVQFRLHPEMRNYLESEGILHEDGLTDDQKARRNRLIDGWRRKDKEARAAQ